MGKLHYWSASSISARRIVSKTSCLFFILNLINVHGFDSLIRLPQARDFRTGPRSRAVLDVNDFGAKGDGLTDDTKAFEDVWSTACSLPSRSKIVIPACNSYLVQPTNFGGPCRSKVTVRISGTIVAPEDPEIWHGLNPRKWLYVYGVNDLTIEGGGIINGMGQAWWARSCHVNATNPCRHAPNALTFHRCRNLKVRNIMVVNSQQMHMAFTACFRVVASHLKVLAPAYSPNTDGIHISASTHVEVKHSTIRTGDDCISVVNNSSSIRIRNISCGPGHGISIGSLGKGKTWAQVHDVSVKGAFLSNTENGVRIKTWQGGSGFASKITFQNLWMKNVSNPIIIDQYYCDSPLPCQNQSSAVKIANISFKGIKGTSATEEAIRFACSESSPCEKLVLEDIQLLPHLEGTVKSFCWRAHGSSRGVVYPDPCFDGSLLRHEVHFTSALHSG